MDGTFRNQHGELVAESRDHVLRFSRKGGSERSKYADLEKATYTPADIADPDRLGRLGSFCRRMGREAHQGEIGLVIGDEYLAFRDFSTE